MWHVHCTGWDDERRSAFGSNHGRAILARACIPLSQLGGARGDLGGEAPAIGGVGGLKLPCMGGEVAETPAGWKYLGGRLKSRLCC